MNVQCRISSIAASISPIDKQGVNKAKKKAAQHHNNQQSSRD